MRLRIDYRKMVRPAILFLMTLIFLNGCYNLKTIPPSNAIKFPENRKLLIIHADDSVWNVRDFRISDNLLTGHLIRDTTGIGKARASYVYAAPLDAVMTDGSILTVPVRNIGKIDYYVVDWWRAIGTTALCFLILVTFFS